MRNQTLTGDNTLYSYRPAPLTSSLFPNGLPPLPQIKDEELYKMVFTHTSVQQLAKRGAMILLKPTEGWKVWDYERLEHVGDALLESIATTLLHDLYPWLRQGGAAIIRDHLVSNRSLAQLSQMYDLPSSILADSSSLEDVKASEKIQASVLEAYVAGVFYDYLKTHPELEEEDKAVPNGKDHTSYPKIVGMVKDDSVPDLKNEVLPMKLSSTLRKEDVPTSLTSNVADFAILARDDDIESGNHSQDGDEPPKALQLALRPDIKPSRTSPAPSPSKSATADLEAMISQLFVSSSESKTKQFDAYKGETEDGASPMCEMPMNSSAVASCSSLDPFTVEFVPVIIPPRQTTTSPIAISESQLRREFTSAGFSGITGASSKAKGEAWAYLCAWLTPLLEPCAKYFYTHLLEEQEKSESSLSIETLKHLHSSQPRLEVPPEWLEEDLRAIGMVQIISQHPFVKASGVRPTYEKSAERRGWKVVCTVVDGNGKIWTGEGIRPNGQAAKNIAAWKVYKALGE